MNQNSVTNSKQVAFGSFAICVVALLFLDPVIVSSGQIGFLTILMYYVALIVFGVIYWIIAIRSGIKTWIWLEILLTVAFIFAPLTLTMYGYGGPA